MFTGIVAAQGVITGVRSSDGRLALTIAAPFPDLALGESVAVNGACLTVADVEAGRFTVHAVTTTRDRTTIGDWLEGQTVNLERALLIGGRFGGHIVQGHVDGVGEVIGRKEQGDALLLDVRIPKTLARYCIPHGSITFDGVSLTVNALPARDTVQVSLVPYTREHTTLGSVAVGTRLHVEGDMIGKFVERLLTERDE